MTPEGILQISFYLAALLLCVKPLGGYMASVYEGRRFWAERALGPLERVLYRACGVNPERSMGWSAYAVAFLALNLIGTLAVYGLLRLQHALPWNPQALPKMLYRNALRALYLENDPVFRTMYQL